MEKIILSPFQEKILKVITEADTEKTVRIISCPHGCGKTTVSELYRKHNRDVIINPRNLPPSFSYGMLILENAPSLLTEIENIKYWVQVAEDNCCGLVVFYNGEVNTVSRFKHIQLNA